MITAAVLTISDSVTAGTRADRSGPAVRDRLEQQGWSVSVMEIIPDEAGQISARLATLADGGQVSAIFTTGGTGVSPRDVTPEATRAVLEREIPGLGELMRLKGHESTPLAMLSKIACRNARRGPDCDAAGFTKGRGRIPQCYCGIGPTRARFTQRANRTRGRRSGVEWLDFFL